MTTLQLLSYASSACGFLASGTMLLDIRAISASREAKGVSLWSSAFFILWGVINSLIFGMSGLLLASVSNGVFVALRCVWLTLAIRYQRALQSPPAKVEG